MFWHEGGKTYLSATSRRSAPAIGLVVPALGLFLLLTLSIWVFPERGVFGSIRPRTENWQVQGVVLTGEERPVKGSKGAFPQQALPYRR